MLIVSGKIYVKPAEREKFLSSSLEAIEKARLWPGCTDFIVAADPVEPNRVNVYEEWDSEAQLLAFRGNGPDDGLYSVIERASVARHIIASSGPP